jgi:hypothetical protein
VDCRKVEVTFDIDANGILNVTAKDMATGKEQKITISGSTSLDKNEIDRMIRDAEQHASEDKSRRELIEARNMADSLAYSVERSIQDLGDRVPAHERARAEALINEIRSALKDESTTLERWRQLPAICSKCRILWPVLLTARPVPLVPAQALVAVVEARVRVEGPRVVPMTKSSMPNTRKSKEGGIGPWTYRNDLFLWPRVKTTYEVLGIKRDALKIRSSRPIANWRANFIPT